MANWFVRSLATGTGAGTSWTNATTTLNAAITLGASGDTYFISDDHAETTASALTITFKGTQALPDIVLCADHTITSPTASDLKTGGSITTTGTSNLLIGGGVYCRGVTFSCGTGAGGPVLLAGAANTRQEIFEACKFVIGATGGSPFQINSGQHDRMIFINTTAQFGAVGQSIFVLAGTFEWRDTTSVISGAIIPTSLLGGSGFVNEGVKLECLDLSALGAGKSVVNVSAIASMITIKECKLNASVGIITGTGGNPSWRVNLIRCDSGNTNYRSEVYDLFGTLTTETTIVRTGGATDGTTSFSQKAITTVNAIRLQTFDLPPLTIWNDTVGSAVTVTVEGIANTVPNNDEVWMDVEYMGDSATPMGSRSSTYKTNYLATAAANTASTSTWGGALTGKFKMAVTITPQQKGPVTVYVRVGTPSATIYIDPLITVT